VLNFNLIINHFLGNFFLCVCVCEYVCGIIIAKI